jgi:hypothetical protein
MDSTCSTGVPHQWQHAKDLPTPAEQNFKYVWLVLSRPWKMDDWHSEHMLLFLLP